MNKNIKWIASWVDQLGREQKYLFHSAESRVVARLDFQLKLMDLGEPIPNEFELDEASIPLPKISSHPTTVQVQPGEKRER